ncbi:hypothetical protein [Nocardioides sp. Kera G14]|uniref:hypothetical protein n=1 Tax=Nocardioides sp. Kera G14 TaxID=2884264 RepID=UPI001D1175F4|nr:hypothetical protein [Nocardioides sp. Kera G14]UDY25320.1 hypothetical protein LH076_08565 [Nocardioides sp. Kera G14]
MIRAASGALSLVLLAAGAVSAGCGDQVSAYCKEVSSRQKHLSGVVDSGDKDALIEALPDLRALQGKAPTDITPDWDTVIKAVGTLERAVEEKDEAKIKAAATALQSEKVTTALANVQQEVRDVCHTPLTL